MLILKQCFFLLIIESSIILKQYLFFNQNVARDY